MTRSTSTTNSHTAARLARLRTLVGALIQGEMMREDIADLVQLSRSGVRSYIKGLREAGVIEIARYIDGTATFLGCPVYRLAISVEDASAYIANLGAASDARPVVPPRSPEGIAARDPHRHFHIMADDTHYAIRVLRKIPEHDPVHTAFFGAPAGSMGAHA